MGRLRIPVSLIAIVLAAGCARQGQPPASRPGTTAPSLLSLDRTMTETTSLRHVNGLVCSNCHNALTVDTSEGFAIAFSHERHQDRGYHCNLCHTSLAHGGRIMPGHPECFACHNGRTASQDCNLCHLRRADINPHPPDFIRIHGEAALERPASCRVCHEESFCNNCHTLQMPHPRGWIQAHGRRIGEGDCFRCHTRRYCNECHRSSRPASHVRRDWMRVHGEASQRLGSNCSLCHARQFCLDCHGLPMPHPGNWVSAHAGPGRAQTGVCRSCHAVEECSSCHTRLRILGHPMPFIAGHAQAARAPSPDCRLCHAPSFCARCHPAGIDGRVCPGGG